MIVKRTNKQIQSILDTLNNEKSFRFNMDIKIKHSMLFALKANLVELGRFYAAIEESMREIGRKYLTDEHSVQSKDGGQEYRTIKPEFARAYSNELMELHSVENDVNLQLITREEFEAFLDKNDGELSAREIDALEEMVEKFRGDTA